MAGSALVVDELAVDARFASVSKNDLIQMTLGYLRDDASYQEVPDAVFREEDSDTYQADPFETLDQVGVEQLMRTAVAKAKPVRPNIKLGICGEHGGIRNR